MGEVQRRRDGRRTSTCRPADARWAGPGNGGSSRWWRSRTPTWRPRKTRAGPARAARTAGRRRRPSRSRPARPGPRSRARTADRARARAPTPPGRRGARRAVRGPAAGPRPGPARPPAAAAWGLPFGDPRLDAGGFAVPLDLRADQAVLADLLTPGPLARVSRSMVVIGSLPGSAAVAAWRAGPPTGHRPAGRVRAGRGSLPVIAPRRSAVCSASWAAVITPAAAFCASVVRLRDS